MPSKPLAAACRRARRAPAFPLVAALAALFTVPSQAQTASSGTLPPITVTGNPLGSDDLIAPAAAYAGTGLLLRAGNTLGATLDGSPGVSSTYFGPNASRPVIRGLDGDRIRILGNGGASIDASGLSYDHAVPNDPIAVERIEVLRGPGVLLYGGNAVGGVVNLIDNRIAPEALFGPEGGIGGRADVGYASGSREKSAGLMLEGGTDRFLLHADAFHRDAGDTGVPVRLACARPGSPALDSRICNSQARSHGGALGATVFLPQGYLGLSVDSYRSDYGTVAEDEVTIGMRSLRTALQGELRSEDGAVRAVRFRLGHTGYRHTEFEAGVPGTVFSNAGIDLRLELRHARIGPLDGLVGLQAEATRFLADGAEAFAPTSRTRQAAAFVYEEIATGWGRLSLGARAELVRVASLGNPLVARFVPAERAFTPRSAALGTLWNLSEAWQLTSTLATSERAPRDYELFADGPHIATNAYEVGNAGLGKERSTNLDVAVAWKRGADSARIGVFANRFGNYLALEATGRLRDTDGNGAGVGVTDDGSGNSVESGGTAAVLPEYAYAPIPARFTGLEASGSWRLAEGVQTLDLEWRADRVRAVNLRTGQFLPRIAPARLGATLVWASGPWGARLGVTHAAAQNRVPAGQRTTAAYTLVDAALTYRQKAGVANLLWYARLDNLGDVLAVPATSILTQTAPGKAPLPGRSLKLGLQASF